MKKILIGIAILLGFVTLNVKAIELPDKTDHEKVKVYLFYGDGCSHCHDFLSYYLKNYKEDYEDYFEIFGFETWSNKDNAEFADEVRERLDVEEQGVPLIVIGDYVKIGFSSSSGNAIIEEALNQYQNESYKDVVEEVKNDSEKQIEMDTLKEAGVKSGIVDEKNSSVSDIIIVIVIFGVIIGGLGFLAFLSREKN